MKRCDIRIISGRGFDKKDTKGATRVAVINEAMARQYFSGNYPMGKTFKYGDKPEDRVQIVGVVADTRDVASQGCAASANLYAAVAELGSFHSSFYSHQHRPADDGAGAGKNHLEHR